MRYCTICREHQAYLRARGKAMDGAHSPVGCTCFAPPAQETEVESATSKKGQRNLYIPSEEWEAIRSAAKARGMSYSAFVRAACVAALTEPKAPQGGGL